MSSPLTGAAEHQVAEYRNHHGELVVTVLTSPRRDVPPAVLQIQPPFLHLVSMGQYYAARTTSGHAVAERLARLLTQRRDCSTADGALAAGEYVWLALQGRDPRHQDGYLVRLTRDCHRYATPLFGVVVAGCAPRGAVVTANRLLTVAEIASAGRLCGHGYLVHLSCAGQVWTYADDGMQP